MPIHFRCAYCNQLMGIARRKAGMVVNCPKCQGQVIVPAPEGQEAAPAPAAPNQPNLFEQADFSKFLKAPPPSGPGPAPQPPAPAAAPMVHQAPPMQAASPAWPGVFPQAPPPRGIFFTPGLLTLTCVLIVLLLGLAFFVGLLLGRSSGP
jgi:phage FluMu protein Com